MRKIRTMRNVWDELAGRKGQGPGAGGRQGAERQGPAGGIIRIQTQCDRQIAGGTDLEGAREVHRQGVHPWIFRRAASRRARRVQGRVKAVVAPKAEIKRRRGAEEFVVLYSLPHVFKESIEIELKGDVLRLTAHGLDPVKRWPFEVVSEALLPKAFSKPRVEHSYAGEVLEVCIAPQEPSPGNSAEGG